MAITESDYIDVSERAQALGLRQPKGFAFLPRNFETATSLEQLCREETEATVRILLRRESIEVEDLVPSEGAVEVIHERDLLWVGPTLFVTAAFLSQNTEAISVAMGVVANYLTDLFKGTATPPQVKLKVVVEETKTKTTKQVEYEGGPEGLSELADAVRGMVSRD